MASPRFRAFSHYNSPFVRFSVAPHFEPAQYLKTSHSDRESQVKVALGRNEAEEVVAAVVVMATMPGCRLVQGVRRRLSFLGRARTNIVRRIHICQIYATLF
jgi:hypothetical protein